MREIFSSSDFNIVTDSGVYMGHISPESAARLANAKVKEWLESQPTVYGWVTSENGNPKWTQFKSVYDGEPTHSAKLVCIEELPKKESCIHSHVTVVEYKDGFYMKFKCIHCEMLLKPTGWVEVE